MGTAAGTTGRSRRTDRVALGAGSEHCSAGEDPALLEQLAHVALAKIADPEQRPAAGALMAMALLEAKAGHLERAETFWNEALKSPVRPPVISP